MKLMPKDDIIEVYVEIINKIIDDLVFTMHESDVPDNFNYLLGKKRVAELIMGIDTNKESKSNDIKINGEDYVSET